MAIRIEWDEFEIALLIEACEEVLRKGKPKSEVVKTVSSNLRKRAISKNIAIDDVFRNENGIALQMQKMAYLLTHGEKGMPGASKLYAEVAELREENPKKFEEILKRAKEEIEMTDLSQQNIDKKALFAQWLNEHPIKKYTPSAIIDALDVASRYCVSKKVCKDGFWSMQNKAEFNAATSKLLSFRLFRLKYRSAAAKMDKAIPLYKAFLDSYVASREENTAEFEGEALNEPDSMLSTAAANSDDIIRLDFSDIGSLIFSKPVCLNYKDHTFTDFNSWASLYAKVAFLLKQDYPQIIVDGGSLSEGAAPEFSMNSKALRKPKAISAHYLGKFNFNGAVISRPENHYEMRDIYQLYAKHHPTFTADDIYNLSKELDTVIYFEALSEVSVRVSHDLFISKEMIPFDTDAVDRAINSFLSKDYIRIREIDSFLIFPNVGYEWNEYLLESFLLSYSKKFALVNNGLSLNNVAGFVVKKSGQINDFIDACAAFLADGRIELKKVDALNYLADMNVISRRGYKDIDLALRRAAQIRRRKE